MQITAIYLSKFIYLSKERKGQVHVLWSQARNCESERSDLFRKRDERVTMWGTARNNQNACLNGTDYMTGDFKCPAFIKTRIQQKLQSLWHSTSTVGIANRNEFFLITVDGNSFYQMMYTVRVYTGDCCTKDIIVIVGEFRGTRGFSARGPGMAEERCLRYHLLQSMMANVNQRVCEEYIHGNHKTIRYPPMHCRYDIPERELFFCNQAMTTDRKSPYAERETVQLLIPWERPSPKAETLEVKHRILLIRTFDWKVVIGKEFCRRFLHVLCIVENLTW